MSSLVQGLREIRRLQEEGTYEATMAPENRIFQCRATAIDAVRLASEAARDNSEEGVFLANDLREKAHEMMMQAFAEWQPNEAQRRRPI
jgi:hypothetical protein